MLQKIFLLTLLVGVTLASDVLEFSDADFDQKIGDHEIILMEFYAPWCGHCQRLEPEYDSAASILKRDDPPVRLGKVNCIDEGKDVCSKFEVSGFPTLKIFRNGKVASDYNGPRESAGIVKYMRQKAGPVSKPLTDNESFDKMLAGESHAVIGFFTDEHSPFYKTFIELANAKGEEFKFAHSFSHDVAKYAGYEIESFGLFKAKLFVTKKEPANIKYSGSKEVKDMEEFVSLVRVKHGAVGLRTQSNGGDFHKPQIIALFKVDFVRAPKQFVYWRNRVLRVAMNFIEEGDHGITFAVSDSDEFSHEVSEFGLTVPTDGTPVVIAYDEKSRKYSMKETFSVDSLTKFANDFKDGKLEPYLKSEDIPATNDEPVKVVVGKTFDDIVNDAEKDVLIEFYAPWCGHCKSLAPKYDELAEKLKDEPSLVIAKMDATANDVPATYSVAGFPTIYYAPKNGKDSPKQYQGAREVDDFLKYLANESTDGLKGYDRKGKKIKSKTDL